MVLQYSLAIPPKSHSNDAGQGDVKNMHPRLSSSVASVPSTSECSCRSVRVSGCGDAEVSLSSVEDGSIQIEPLSFGWMILITPLSEHCFYCTFKQRVKDT